MLKIIRVTNDIYPDVVGGIPLHVNYLTRDISKMGYFTTVLACTKKNNLYKNNGQDYKIIYHKILFSPLSNSFSPSLFKTLMGIKNDYSLIHAHSHLFFSTIIASLVRKIGSPPLIITCHGIMSASAPDWFNILYMKTVGKWTLRSADKIICYTQLEKKKLVSMLKIDSEKIRVIPNGVDTQLFKPNEDFYKEKNQDNEINILWVGRFVFGKGVEYIIHAAEILVKDFPNIKILLVGKGPLKRKIEVLIKKLDLEKNITIIEDIPNEDMPRIYQKSDIFVLPSLNEGVPKTLLEAMACGKPVVVSEFQHLKEIVNDTCLTFPKGDVQSLVNNIVRLIKDKDLAKNLGERGRNKVIKDFSWKNTVMKTVELYEEVAI